MFFYNDYFLSSSYVYIQLLHFNGNDNYLLIVIKVKLLNLNLGA